MTLLNSFDSFEVLALFDSVSENIWIKFSAGVSIKLY